MLVVAYLMYGPYGAFAPYFDSSFATLTRMDSSLLYSVYGDDMGVTYAHRLSLQCVCVCVCVTLIVCLYAHVFDIHVYILYYTHSHSGINTCTQSVAIVHTYLFVK